MALFLVLVLPACWYGELTRSWIAGQAAPSSSNNNEEREEHEKREEQELAALGTAPPTPELHARPFQVTTVSVVAHAPALRASVAPKLPVSQFSVRRLI